MIGAVGSVGRLGLVNPRLRASVSLPLDALSAAAAFSMRRLRTAYTGALIRVRRSTNNAEMDIGYGADGWLDEGALLNWLGVPRRPLDVVAGAAAAFSLRLLNTAYTGSAVRVRRSSDNIEQDIGFTATGDLDSVALLAFVGAGSGFVAVWYDQSGNGRHVSNPTGAAQPRIVNAGVVDTLNGRPIVQFLGAGSLVGQNPITALQGFIVEVSNSSGIQTEYSTGPTGIISLRTTSIERRVGTPGSNTNAAEPVDIGTLRQYTDTASPNGIRRNGTEVLLGGPATSAGSTVLEIGGRGGALRLNGGISELILFTAQVSVSDRMLLEQSQAAYYGITYATALPSGFVTTWYDQSGNGRDAVQATAANQPEIVTSGIVNRVNARPGMFVDGLLKRLTTTHSLQGYTQAYLSFVGTRIGNRSPGVSSFYAGTGLVGSSDTRFALMSGAGGTSENRMDCRVQVGAPTVTTFGPALGSPGIMAGRVYANGTATAHANGVSSSAATVTFAPQAGDILQAIGNGQTSRSFWGQGAETILFNNALTDEQHAALTANQGAAFNITVT